MANYFRLTFRFLNSCSHGRGDGGEPEWPPSPLRALQSLTAAAAAHWNERLRIVTAEPALSWLEQIAPPTIVAAPAVASEVKYRLYVPDNVGDKIAKSWSGGRDASIADYRTEKDVRPVAIHGDCAVHYLWPLAEADAADCRRHLGTLLAAARAVTHLGWGVDMVVSDAGLVSDVETAALAGERWLPGSDGTALRVPIRGTLAGLVRKHEQFLDRLTDDGFKPVAPLSAFRTVGYRRTTDVSPSHLAVFQFLKVDSSGFRSFDPVRQTMSVAGMLRHAAIKRWEALSFESEAAAGFLHGHGEARGEEHRATSGPRLAYLPIPSIEYRGDGRFAVGRIRRALLTVVGGRAEDLLRKVARLLSAAPLEDERTKSEEALLSPLPHSDKMIRRYIDHATAWSTVTPVILPGYDDPRKLRRRLFTSSEAAQGCTGADEQKALLEKLDRRIDLLLRKAIRQAGYSEELAKHAEINWANVGFRAGTSPATQYAFPNKLRRFRRLHVRIRWKDPAGNPVSVPGPICLGVGRFIGLGLLVAETD